MRSNERVDWSECSLVEVKPGVQSGAPVLRGTRMPAEAIVDDFDYGVSVAEIAEQFEVLAECIEAILSYAKSYRIAHRVDKNGPSAFASSKHEVRTFVETGLALTA
jgi:uncharacterized protein (DUF433 family)